MTLRAVSRPLLFFLVSLAFFAGCPGPRHKDVPGRTFDDASSALPELTGTAEDGVFHDTTFAYVLPVPDGWVAEPRTSNSPLRVVVFHVKTGTRIEVRVYPLPHPLPDERGGCRWTFEEAVTSDELKIEPHVSIATCTPDTPGRSRVFAQYFEWDGKAWELDTIVPDGQLKEGGDAAAVLKDGFRVGN
jgi:hypothetical protein